MRLFNSSPDEQVDSGTLVKASLDVVVRIVPAASTAALRPGESIILTQKLYREFWAEAGSGPVLIGEVSAVNDDRTDNHFAKQVGRFPEIEEDEPPLHYLCNEYPEAK